MLRLLALALALVAVLGGAASARAVKVTSGEHGEFSRLVLEFDGPVDWQLGRTERGYELRVGGPQQTYDLSDVYRLITRDRLTSIWSDPANGHLALGVGCACHAIPFEYRPGTVVIDLKDGPPPEGSGFELTLAGQALLPLGQKPVEPREAAATTPTGTYDWKSLALAESRARREAAATGPSAEEAPDRTLNLDPSLEPLRQTLLEQIARGAAQGVVEMADLPKDRSEPAAPGAVEAALQGEDQPVNLRIGNQPGVKPAGVGQNVSDSPEGLTSQGETCFATEDLGIESWGDGRPPAQQIGDVWSGLVGEFDKPDPEGLRRSVRLLLFLSFGAEARNLLQAMAADLPEEPMWRSMARALDSETDPQPAFRGMGACDTPAALWAMLGETGPTEGEKVDTAAVLRAFSSLPVHLRRSLGPRLADRFLLRGDTATAHTIRDATLRAPGEPGAEVQLFDARLDLEEGEDDAGEEKLTALIEDPGPATPEAVLTLVEARIAASSVLEVTLLHDLEALAEEFVGTDSLGRYRRALVLGHAAASDFETAFADIIHVPEAERELWQLVARNGADSVLLAHAVLGEGQDPPEVGAEAAVTLARRLLRLGFAPEAAAWMSQVEKKDPLLMAEIALARSRPAEALEILAEAEGETVLGLRALAMERLGQDAAAAQIFEELGNAEATHRAMGRSQDWPGLGEAEANPWTEAARTILPPAGEAGPEEPASAPPPPGSLAEGAALLDRSAETRAALDALLAGVAGPTAPDEAAAAAPPTQ